MFCYWTYLIPNWFDDKVSTFPFSDIQKQENPVGIAKYDRFLEEILLASLTWKSCWIARLIRHNRIYNKSFHFFHWAGSETFITIFTRCAISPSLFFFLMLDIKMVGTDKLSGTMVYN